MKYTVANQLLKLTDKHGIYFFLPYERLDDKEQSIGNIYEQSKSAIKIFWEIFRF
jgi:hypothetical protein